MYLLLRYFNGNYRESKFKLVIENLYYLKPKSQIIRTEIKMEKTGIFTDG